MNAKHEKHWYLVEHFEADDVIRQRRPLKTYVVQGTSHGDALGQVPEHPREWGSCVRPLDAAPITRMSGDES